MSAANREPEGDEARHEELVFNDTSMIFEIDGKTYTDPKQLPPEMRKLLEEALKAKAGGLKLKAGVSLDPGTGLEPPVKAEFGSGNLLFVDGEACAEPGSMVIVGDRVYTDPEKMPPEVRAIYEQLPASVKASPPGGSEIKVVSLSGETTSDPIDLPADFRPGTALICEGKTYTDPAEMPPELRAIYDRAAARTKPARPVPPDRLPSAPPTGWAMRPRGYDRGEGGAGRMLLVAALIVLGAGLLVALGWLLRGVF
jgi:hypothetical protein